MNRSTFAGFRSWRSVAVGMAASLVLPIAAAAAERDRAEGPRASTPPAVSITELASRELQRSLERPDAPPPATSRAERGRVASPPMSSSGHPVGRKILGGVLGGVAGFFAGGYLGAWIDGDCGGCDDPGLKGALIGAPVGAAIGAVFGAIVF